MKRRTYLQGTVLAVIPWYYGGKKPDVTGRLEAKVIGHNTINDTPAGYVRARARIESPDSGRFDGRVSCSFKDKNGDEVSRDSKPVSVSSQDSAAIVSFDLLGLRQTVEAVTSADFSVE